MSGVQTFDRRRRSRTHPRLSQSATHPERYFRGDITFKVIRTDIAPKPIVQALRAILSFVSVCQGQTNQANSLASSASLPRYRYMYLDERQFRSPWRRHW